MTRTRIKIERDRPVFFEDIKHDASLWVYRHGLRNIVLAELLKQTHAFPKPSMRRQLMKEIRIAARDRMSSKPLDFMMLVPTNQTLMEQIIARRCRRASAKAKYIRLKQQLRHYFKNTVLAELLKQTLAFSKPSMRRQLMKEIRIAARRKQIHQLFRSIVLAELLKQTHCLPKPSTRRQLMKEIRIAPLRKQIRQVFRTIVLAELLKQTYAFSKPSMRRELMREIRIVARRKQMFRLVVLAELLKQTHAFSKASMRRQLMKEIRIVVHRKQVFRSIVLAELLKQTHAFSKPSMRRQLMKEISIVAQSRMECKQVGVAQFSSTNHALMKEIRVRGLERASVKANHILAMHELLESFHAKTTMEVLHENVPSRKVNEDSTRLLFVGLDDQHENHVFEQHQHKFQRRRTDDMPVSYNQDSKGFMQSPRCIRDVMVSNHRLSNANAAA